MDTVWQTKKVEELSKSQTKKKKKTVSKKHQISQCVDINPLLMQQ